jgi:hypothetical protein
LKGFLNKEKNLFKRMFEKSLMVYQIFLDPPKSPLKRGTLKFLFPQNWGLGGITSFPTQRIPIE